MSFFFLVGGGVVWGGQEGQNMGVTGSSEWLEVGFWGLRQTWGLGFGVVVDRHYLVVASWK